MTSRASLKLFLRNVLFFDNISVLKVYSKSFVYNAFNDFARYSPHPSFICSVKRDTRTLPNIPSMKTSQQKRPEKSVQLCNVFIYITDCFYTVANSNNNNNNNNNFLSNLSANY